MYEYPDIIIEFKNGLTLVVDAKDAEYISGRYNYRRQIDDYMEYAKVVIEVDAVEDVVVFVVGLYPGADATTVAL